MKKDVPRHLAPVVVKYYFIQDLHTSLKLEVAKSGLNCEILTSILMLHCCVKPLLYYSTTLSRWRTYINKPITAHNRSFSIWCWWAPHLLLFYYLMLYHKITKKYCYQTFSPIIYHHPKLKRVASVASKVLERAKPSLWLFLTMKTKNFDACHPDGERSQILSILAALPNHITTLWGRVGVSCLGW